MKTLALTLALVACSALPAWAQTVEEVEAADGVTLRVLHVEQQGPPVILIHGYGSNVSQFTVPGRSFAKFLNEAGYDLWLMNMRHAGRGRMASEGPADHSFDDVVVLDVEATVAAVRQRTRQRPFLIGHSMGGMVSLAWLQGVERKRVPISEERMGLRIVASPKVAKQRANDVRGVVALGSPARMAWPDGGRDGLDGNRLIHSLTRLRVDRTLRRRVRVLPWKRTSDLVTDRLTKLPGFRRVLRRVVRASGKGRQSELYFRPGSIDHDVLYAAMDTAVDDMSVTVLRQFADGVRRGDMRELHTADRDRQPYSYAEGHARVRAPVLWVGGSHDKLANDDVIADAVERLEVRDKTYLGVPMGHVDMVFGKEAPERVWEPVRDWLAARR